MLDHRRRARDQPVGQPALLRHQCVGRAPVVGVGVDVQERARARTPRSTFSITPSSLPSLTFGTEMSILESPLGAGESAAIRPS